MHKKPKKVRYKLKQYMHLHTLLHLNTEVDGAYQRFCVSWYRGCCNLNVKEQSLFCSQVLPGKVTEISKICVETDVK
jgi:hypothetical protein